jgi:predicted Zn-dependent peptidase
MPHTRSVSVCIFVGVGSRYESDAAAGISHFIEHLLFKGTEKRAQARDIAAAIEGVGGIINAGTDRELTIYWIKAARPHFQLALDVLVDMLTHSRLEPGEVEKERQVIIEEIHMVKDSPHQSVGMLVDELLWPNHPLGRDVAGTPESVSGITREMITDFVAGRYHPGDAVVSVAGAISHEEAVEEVDRLLGGWGVRPAPPGFRAHTPGANPRLRVEARDTEQTHLSLALPGLPLMHPKRYVLGLLNVILGEGMSSRLFVEIRDNLGLAYSVQSYVEHLHDTGALTVYAGVEHDKLGVAVRAILDQMAGMWEPVSADELTKAKELSKGRMLLRMEDSRSVAGWVGGQEILTGRILDVDEVVSLLEAVTAEEIAQLARELITEDQLRLAVVGPESAHGQVDGLLKL